MKLNKDMKGFLIKEIYVFEEKPMPESFQSWLYNKLAALRYFFFFFAYFLFNCSFK